jgi:hypothetical protein
LESTQQKLEQSSESPVVLEVLKQYQNTKQKAVEVTSGAFRAKDEYFRKCQLYGVLFVSGSVISWYVFNQVKFARTFLFLGVPSCAAWWSYHQRDFFSRLLICCLTLSLAQSS